MTQFTTYEPNTIYQSARDLAHHPEKLSWFQNAAKKVIHRVLCHLEEGELQIHYGSEIMRFGKRSADNLSAEITVRNADFFRNVLLGGSLGFAESYMMGHWTTNDLTSLIRIFSRNLKLVSGMDKGVTKLLKSFAIMAHRLRSNSKDQARKNIHEHYDLSNDFFTLFLDETMMYSSAYFSDEKMNLAEASTEKLDRICRKLQLRPEDHVIEIGTGWGGFAEHAVKNYGCKVTTTTISLEQYEFAAYRFEKEGISDRVELLLKDYRDLEGEYDKLVSIEMIEAVGHEYFDEYFSKCSQLLKPDGEMLIQAITIPEQRFDQYVRSVDFIQKYIFPGGCLPSMLSMQQSIGSRTDLRIIHTEDFASHYARTLNLWNKRFTEEADSVREMGFTEEFIRKWHYYFCYCEAAFMERVTGVVQLLAAKPQSRLEVTPTI